MKTNKSIHKSVIMRSFFKNQEGYGRLTSGTVSLFVVVLSVLAYQVALSNPFQIKQTQQQVTLISSVQLFPQTLPLLNDIGYLVEIEDGEGRTIDLGVFFHKQQGIVTNDRGSVMSEGILPLPVEVTEVKRVSISLFDARSRQRPIVIPFLTGQINDDRALVQFIQTFDKKLTGQYSLATPTDNNALVNERSGLWFGDIIQNVSKLDLPQLPSGWIYEGWAVVDNQPLTTGKFARGNASDLFSGFSDAKSNTPQFPGEDFLLDPPVELFTELTFPVDLAGQQVKITIEPINAGIDPTGEGPFPVELFSSSIPRLAQAGVIYDLDLTIDDFPKATVVLR
jgi:hypothetical protein